MREKFFDPDLESGLTKAQLETFDKPLRDLCATSANFVLKNRASSNFIQF
jgi:hypothetical protein